MKIVHASISENKDAGRNGQAKAGDQTGKEVCVRAWWDKGWTMVLRHPNEAIADKAANIGQLLADSNLVGYDQTQRNTLFQALKKYGYLASAYIASEERTETDCSAFVTACYICAGIRTLIYSSNAPTTSTMEHTFANAGFNVLKDKSLLRSPDELKKGDILLLPGSHVVMCIETGSKYGVTDIDYFPKYNGLANTLSQALSELGIDSSKSYRKKIYQANFSDSYSYTAAQNNAMLKKLKSGYLIKP